MLCSLPEMQLASGFEFLLLGGIALAVIAGLLLPKPKNDLQTDDRNPTLTSSGDALPYVIGFKPVSGLPVWVGDRQVKQEKVKTGGKGGSSKQKQNVYIESACHALALGPVSKLHKIYVGNEVIFQGPISASDTPSGTKLFDRDGNAFIIYWGEKTQPIDVDLEKALKVASRWPFIAKIFWLNRRLGTGSTWPDLMYDIEADCIAKIPLPGSDECIPETIPSTGSGSSYVPGSLDQGANGAHILYQLITAKYPHGVGMDTNYLNSTAIITLGQRLQTEKLAQSVSILDYAVVSDILEFILSDASCLLIENQGQLAPIPLRDNDEVLPYVPATIVFPAVSMEIEHGNTDESLLVFQYLDASDFFATKDIQLRDDATSRLQGNRKIKTVPLETVTSKRVAVAVGDKKQQIGLSDKSSIALKASKTLRKIRPGQVLALPDSNIRVTSVEITIDSPEVLIEGIRNQYWLPGSWSPTLPDPSGSGTLEQDTIVRLFELPRSLSGDEISIAILRGREDGQDIPATVYWSTNGINYSLLGEIVNVLSLGSLQENIYTYPFSAIPLSRTLTYSPVCTINDANVGKVQDLSSDYQAWISDKQIVMIGNEMLSLRSISPSGIEDGYELNGLVRGQLFTEIAQHESAGSPDILIGLSDLVQGLTDTSWVPGQKIFLKVVPYGFNISTVTAIEYKILGKAKGPLPVSNIGPLSYDLGVDYVLTWNYSVNKGSGWGAGELVGGAPLPPTTPTPEGGFRVEILTPLGTVIRTANVSTPTYTYEYADRVTDDTENSIFIVRITATNNGVGGYPRSFTANPNV